MPTKQTLNDVPSADVGKIVQGFVRSKKVTKITATKKFAQELWDVSAVIPDILGDDG